MADKHVDFGTGDFTMTGDFTIEMIPFDPNVKYEGNGLGLLVQTTVGDGTLTIHSLGTHPETGQTMLRRQTWVDWKMGSMVSDIWTSVEGKNA